MGTKNFVSRKTALSFIALCVILSAVVIGVLVQNFQNSNANLRNQVAAKDLIIGSLNSNVTSLNATVGDLNSTINQMNAQVASLKNQVKSENSSNLYLTNQLATSASALVAANQEESTLQNEIQSNPIIATLQGQLTSTQGQVTTLQNQVAADQTTIGQLNTQVANLQSTLTNWDDPVNNAFSLIQITDTQFLSESNPTLFNTLNSWIVNNTNALNVSMVVNTGDIVNVPDNVTNWQDANVAMMELYNNGVPYCWCAGNHDFIGESNPTGNANGRWLGGQYPAFNVAALQQEPYWVSSIFNGSSTAVQFNYGNYRFMIINIAYDANATVLDWMQTLIKTNPNVNVILTTHNFLNGEGYYGYPPSPADIAWAANFNNTISGYANVFLTLSGHSIGEGTAYNLKNGNREDIFFNRQQEDNLQGGATARIYTFNMSNPAHPTINVYTYETYASGSGGTPKYLTDASNQFNFTSNLIQYSPSPVTPAGNIDFVGSSGFTTSFASPITLASYNQTFDLLRLYSLALNGATYNVTMSTMGSNIVINTYSSNNIQYTVTRGNGTQTFQVASTPTSVTIDGGTPQTLPSSNWNYTNGTVTVTGATQTVTISLPST